MALSQAQRALISKIMNVGNSDMAVPLTDEVGCYLLSVIISDLELQDHFPEVRQSPPDFFETYPASSLSLPGLNFRVLAEQLFSRTQDSDTYFACLATLHKARLKYERILERQPLPTFEQVGPRGLLQYGSLRGDSLCFGSA